MTSALRHEMRHMQGNVLYMVASSEMSSLQLVCPCTNISSAQGFDVICCAAPQALNSDPETPTDTAATPAAIPFSESAAQKTQAAKNNVGNLFTSIRATYNSVAETLSEIDLSPLGKQALFVRCGQDMCLCRMWC